MGKDRRRGEEIRQDLPFCVIIKLSKLRFANVKTVYIVMSPFNLHRRQSTLAQRGQSKSIKEWQKCSDSTLRTSRSISHYF